jgi:hypothetical protein
VHRFETNEGDFVLLDYHKNSKQFSKWVNLRESKKRNKNKLDDEFISDSEQSTVYFGLTSLLHEFNQMKFDLLRKLHDE